MATKEYTNLRHGDVVVLECDGPPGWDGLLSSDPRSRADLEVVYQRKDGQTKNPDFLSKCVFRVDTSRGDGAPGSPVNFGDPIRLQLLRTRHFLTATANPSKHRKRAFRLLFNKNKTKESHLRLQPHLKIRSEGELVYYGEPLGLLDVNGRFIQPVEGGHGTAGAASGTGNDEQPSSLGVLSHDERHAWRFKRFMPYDATLEHVIVAGDLLRLFHMEEEAFIVGHVVDEDLRVCDDFRLDESNNEKLSELYRRAFVGMRETLSDTKKMFVGLRQSQSKRKARTKHSIMSVWEVHNEQEASGGPITFNQNIRLRHFATGSFLCIRSNSSEGAGEAVLLPSLNGRLDEEDTLFSFEYVSSNAKQAVAELGGAEGEGEGAGSGGGLVGVQAGARGASKPSTIYCSLLALTRLMHVSTREYVTIKPDGTPEFGASQSFGDSVNDTATEVSSLHDDENDDEGSSDAFENNNNDGDDEDGMRNESGTQKVNNNTQESPAVRKKEFQLSTSVDKPDESVYQLSAVSPMDVDHSFEIMGHADRVIGFVEIAQQILVHAEGSLTGWRKQILDRAEELRKKKLLNFLPGEKKAGVSYEHKQQQQQPGRGVAAAAAMFRNDADAQVVKGLQKALSGLVAFVCGMDSDNSFVKWTDAKLVTTPPLKLQQHALVEQGMVELLLMLAQTLFKCVKQVEKTLEAKAEASADLEAASGPGSPVASPGSEDLLSPDDGHVLGSGLDNSSGAAAEVVEGTNSLATTVVSSPKALKVLGKQAKRTADALKFLASTLPSRAILNELGLLTYKLLMLTVSGNKKCVARIMNVEGIDMMIKHKLSTSPSWDPPIKEVLVANALQQKGKAGSGIKTVYKTDIKFLLDKVHDKIKRHEIPDAGLFSFLADVCAPNDEPEPDVQTWICELLLGHTSKSADQSCFVYGTRVVKKIPQVDESNGGKIGDREDCEDVDEEEEKWEVEVEVSLLGKLRPKYNPDMAVVGVQNVASKAGGAAETYDRVSPVVGMTYQQWADTFEEEQWGTLTDPRAINGGRGKWRRLSDLNLSELRFFTSTLKLLALICTGRNASAQLLVKKLISVDVLLSALWSLRDLGRGSFRKRDWNRLVGASRESSAIYRAALAHLHSALISLLRALHVHSTMIVDPSALTAEGGSGAGVSGATGALLVWTLGQEEGSDDYDDVRGVVSNRIFSAPTQFDEPPSLGNMMDLSESERIVAKFEAEFLNTARETKKAAVGTDAVAEAKVVYRKTVAARARKILRKCWGEFMVVDLNSFIQRSRLRKVIIHTLKTTDSAAAASRDAGSAVISAHIAAERAAEEVRQQEQGIGGGGRLGERLAAARRRGSASIGSPGGSEQDNPLRLAAGEEVEKAPLLEESPAALSAVHIFLLLIKDLVATDFFSPLYDAFPRCELVVGGKTQEPFIYRRTKRMKVGTTAQRGVDGRVPPELYYSFGSVHAKAPVLAMHSDVVVPEKFRKAVDDDVIPAVPHGMCIRLVANHSLYIFDESDDVSEYSTKDVTLVLLPKRPNSETSYAPMMKNKNKALFVGGENASVSTTDQLRMHLRRLQVMLDPREDSSPALAGMTGVNPNETWQALADDESLAEEHFKRLYCYTQKSPLDGVLQQERLNILQAIMDVYYITVTTNQAMRVTSLWSVFQRVFKAEIEDKVFPAVIEEDDEDEYDADDNNVGDKDDNDKDDDDGDSDAEFEGENDVLNSKSLLDVTAFMKESSLMHASKQPSGPAVVLEEAVGGDNLELNPMAKRGSLNGPAGIEMMAIQAGKYYAERKLKEAEERRYMDKKVITDNEWGDFRFAARRELAALVVQLAKNGNEALMGDIEESPRNMALQKKRGLSFLDLVLYDDDALTARAVKMLQRHFNRRVELSTLLLQSTLVLEEEDKATLKFVAKRKLALQRALVDFANPYDSRHIRERSQRQKLMQQRMKSLADTIRCLTHDPDKHGSIGAVGLINISWTKLWDINKSTVVLDGEDAEASQQQQQQRGVKDVIFTLKNDYGEHPLVGGMPRREVLEEMNQQILAEQQVHLIVLGFLDTLGSSFTQCEDFYTKLCAEQREVVRACIVFLYYFIYDHKSNAMLLSDVENLGTLLTLLPLWEGTEAIMLMTEILVDNAKANVCLEESHIKGFVSMLVASVKTATAQDEVARQHRKKNVDSHLTSGEIVCGGDWTRPSCLLSLLSTVVETEEGPVTARQELVVQLLEDALQMQESASGNHSGENLTANTPTIASGGHEAHKGFDSKLLASFLFVEPKKLDTMLSQRRDALAAAAGGGDDENFTTSSGGSDDSSIVRLTAEDVTSLYEVSRVEKEYERLTKKRKPPKKANAAEPVKEWVRTMADSRPLADESHLNFHVKFVDLLGMLAKGDNQNIEQWCSLFISGPMLFSGLRSRHYVLKGSFLRCMHGFYFSKFDDTLSGTNGARSADFGGDGNDGDAARDLMYNQNQQTFLEVFSDLNDYLQLFHKLQRVTFKEKQLNEEEETFEKILVGVVLPFLRDFFRGDWPLNLDQQAAATTTTGRAMDDLRSSLAASGGGVEEKEAHRGQRESGTSGSNTPPQGGEQGHNSLLRICALKERNNIVLNLAKMGLSERIQRWENARVGVDEALDAARLRRIGGGGWMGNEFMVAPDSALSTMALDASRRIDEFKVVLKTEGIDGDEEDEVNSQRRKKSVVNQALPHFIECFFDVIRGEGSTSANGNGMNVNSTAALGNMVGYTKGGKFIGGGDIDKNHLLNARRDPFFDVFVDTIRSRVMDCICSQASETSLTGQLQSGEGGGGIGPSAGTEGPSSGLSGSTAEFETTKTLAGQLATLTGGRTIEEALEVIDENEIYSEMFYNTTTSLEDDGNGPDGGGLFAAVGLLSTRRGVKARDRFATSAALPSAAGRVGSPIGLGMLNTNGSEVSANEQAEKVRAANAYARDVAFKVFTKQSQLYVEKLLKHLCDFIGNEFTDCDMYLCGAVQRIMESRRDEIEAEFERTPTMSKAQLMSALSDDDLVCKLMQCTFINLGGPESVMSLVSLGAQADDLNAYYKSMVPCANELGNAMLEGGNYEVQRRFFEIFVQKKSSFESHKEESFLRSLQAQLRASRKLFLDPNLDLNNRSQLNAIERASRQIGALLKFVQNLVEGHQTAHQEFMLVQPSATKTVNIVKEVGLLYLALFESIESELKVMDDRDFNAKHAPPVAGYRAAAAAAGAAGDFGRFKIVAWHRDINFVKLKVIMPILVSCLHTMQEFCAGPCLKNQLALVRTGVCNTFPSLFTFFGALQLRQDAPPVLKKAVASMMASADPTAAAAAVGGEGGEVSRKIKKGVPNSRMAPQRRGSHTGNVQAVKSKLARQQQQQQSGTRKVTMAEPQEFASFRETWALASQDLFFSTLQEASLRSAVTGIVGSAVGFGAKETDATGTLADDKSSYVLSFGKSINPGSKWVGNDPALLYLLFRLRMDIEKKQKARNGGGSHAAGGGRLDGHQEQQLAYPDEQVTLVALLGSLTLAYDRDGDGRADSITPPRSGGGFVRGEAEQSISHTSDTSGVSAHPHHHTTTSHVSRQAPNDFDVSAREGGWVRAKQVFVDLNTREEWRPQQQGVHGGEWRFRRQLRKPPDNIYSDIEELTGDALEMENALVSFLLSLVEGGDVHKEVADSVLSNWDSTTMLGNTVNWLSLMDETSNKFSKDLNATSPMNAGRNRVDQCRTLALNYHILLESMSDTGRMPLSFKVDYRKLCNLRGLELSSENGVPNVGRVEVVGKNEQVSVVYFPVPAIVSACWMRPEVQHCKELILYPDDVSKRSNPEEKINNFLEESDDLVDILEHEYMLYEMRYLGLWGRCIAGLGRQSSTLSYIALALSLLINTFLLMYTRYDNENGTTVLGKDDVYATFLPGIHAIISVLLLASYFVSSGWRNIIVGLRKNPDGILVIRSRFSQRLVKMLLPFLVVQNYPWSALDGGDDKLGGSSLTLVELSWALKGPWFFYTSDWRSIYYSVFLVVSLFGLFVDPLLYALCMFDVVRMNSTMQKVIRAFTKNLDQVVVTVVFLAIMLYMFAAFGFSQNFMYEFEEHNACHKDGLDTDSCGGSFISMLQLHLDYGVINPLVFTDSDGPVSTPIASVFGFLYYFLINLVITAIVSGIIIDTFAQMRSDRSEVVENLHTACFICDIEPEDFEQFNVRYDDHIKNDHNMWQYVWLKIYLREKDRTLYSGTEMHIAPYLQRHSPRCMPIKKSRAIQGQVKDKATLPTILGKINQVFAITDNLTNAVEELRSQVKETNARIQELSRATSMNLQPQKHHQSWVGVDGSIDQRSERVLRSQSSLTFIDEPDA